MTSPPVIANFRDNCHATVCIDAYQVSLEAVLTQVNEDRERRIECASRSLNEHDSNLPSSSLEYMAAQWAVTVILSVYLRGGLLVSVVTDNVSLRYLTKQSSINGIFVR